MKDFLQAVETFLLSLAAAMTGLKLAGLLQWSWWLVLVPLWGPFAIIAVMVVLVFVFFLVTGLYAHWKRTPE